MSLLVRNLLLIATAGLSLLAAGCNTISGFGQDVEAAGEAVSDTAEDTKQQM